MEMEPNRENSKGRFAEDQTDLGLQEELQFFLETRLNGLLQEAESMRTAKSVRKGRRKKFGEKGLSEGKEQEYLPFLCPRQEGVGEDPPFSPAVGQGNEN